MHKVKFSSNLTKLTLDGNISVQLLEIYQFLPLPKYVGKGHLQLLICCSVSRGFVLLFYMNYKLYL